MYQGYVCMYVCYVCACVCVLCVCLYEFVYVHVHVQCIDVCAWVRFFFARSTGVHVCRRVYMCLCVCMRVYVCRCVCVSLPLPHH